MQAQVRRAIGAKSQYARRMADTRVLVPLLAGYEELEAVTIIDVLRRAEIEVVVASDEPGPVPGAHGLAVVAPAAIGDVEAEQLAAVALPGGMPGAQRLADSAVVQQIVRTVHDRGGIVAAICAAPMALAAAGVIAGRRVTCYPGFERRLTGAQCVQEAVVCDGAVITSRGPGTALAFALALVRALGGDDTARRLAAGMLTAA